MTIRLSAFTGARAAVLPMDLLPVVRTVAAGLIVVGLLVQVAPSPAARSWCNGRGLDSRVTGPDNSIDVEF